MSAKLPSWLAGFAGGAAAGCLAALAFAPAPLPAPRAAVEPEGRAHDRQDEHLAELRRIRELLETSLSDGEPRESRSADTKAGPELVTAMTELAEALSARGPGSSSALEARSAAPWREGADLEVSPSKRESLWSRPVDKDSSFQIGHRFSTTREILEAYGAPDAMDVDEGGQWEWIYRSEDGNSAIEITFFEGVVIQSMKWN